GTRSGVNWMRANVPPTTFAKVSTARVLATPGTPSSSTWPLDSRPTSIRSTSWSWPTMIRLTSKMARSRVCTSAARPLPAPPGAQVDADVLATARAVEDQVAALGLRRRDVTTGVVLVTGEPREQHADTGEAVADQSRAVEADGVGAGVDAFARRVGGAATPGI